MAKVTMDMLAAIMDCAAGVITVAADCAGSLLAGYQPTENEIAAIQAAQKAVATAYDSINGNTQDFQCWAWDNDLQTTTPTIVGAFDITSVVGFAGRAIQYCADTISLPFSAADKIPMDIAVAKVLAKQLNDITIHWPGNN